MNRFLTALVMAWVCGSGWPAPARAAAPRPPAGLQAPAYLCSKCGKVVPAAEVQLQYTDSMPPQDISFHKRCEGRVRPAPAALSVRVEPGFKGDLGDLLRQLENGSGLKYLAPVEVLKSAKPVEVSGEKTVGEILGDASAQAGVAWELTPDGVVAIRAKGADAGADAATLTQALEIEFGKTVSSESDRRILDRIRRKVLTPAARRNGQVAGPVEAFRIRFPAHWHVDPIMQAGYRISTNDPATKQPPEGIGYAGIDIWMQDRESPEQVRKEIAQAEGRAGAAATRFEIAGRPAVQYRYEREVAVPGFPGMTKDTPNPRQTLLVTAIADGRTWIHLEGTGAVYVPKTAVLDARATAARFAEMEAIGRSFEFLGSRPASR